MIKKKDDEKISFILLKILEKQLLQENLNIKLIKLKILLKNYFNRISSACIFLLKFIFNNFH